MGNIRNLQLLKRFTDLFKLKIGDPLGDRVGEIVVPTVNLPILDRGIQTISNSVSDGTAATIFTTSLVRNTFLVGVGLSLAKDANATSLFSRITARPDGRSGNLELVRIRTEPLTAGQFTENIQFAHPIKLARGSTVSVTNSTTTASIDTTGIIFFYEEVD